MGSIWKSALGRSRGGAEVALGPSLAGRALGSTRVVSRPGSDSGVVEVWGRFRVDARDRARASAWPLSSRPPGAEQPPEERAAPRRHVSASRGGTPLSMSSCRVGAWPACDGTPRIWEAERDREDRKPAADAEAPASAPGSASGRPSSVGSTAAMAARHPPWRGGQLLRHAVLGSARQISAAERPPSAIVPALGAGGHAFLKRPPVMTPRRCDSSHLRPPDFIYFVWPILGGVCMQWLMAALHDDNDARWPTKQTQMRG